MNIPNDIWKTPWGAEIRAPYRPDTCDWNSHQSIIANDEYNFTKLLAAGADICIDIGAYIGSATLAMLTKSRKVFAVEPLPENCEMIYHGADLNNIGPRLILWERAIGGFEPRSHRINYGNPETKFGKVHEFIGNAATAQANKGRTIDVPVLHLDALMSGFRTQCQLLKIDCEGGEWACFADASDRSLSRIDRIVGELHFYNEHKDKTFEEFLALFRGQFGDVSEEFVPVQDPKARLRHFVLERKGLR